MTSRQREPTPVVNSQQQQGHEPDDDDDDDGASTSSSSSSSASSADAAPILDEQFLPRILALFFAIFHPTEGPKVVYQVPEGSVTAEEVGDKRAKGRRFSSDYKGKQRQENQGEETDTELLQQDPLFEFDTLSDYLIPKAPLCGRLVTCTTRGFVSSPPPAAKSQEASRSGRSRSRETGDGQGRSTSKARIAQKGPGQPGPTGQPRYYKVLSHPVLLEDSHKYQRNTFIFNLAFVFDGKADVKSYEPVVRKCARALRGLEESASFLSSPRSQPRMYGIVEQLFQDLNSYCEAFVSLPDAPHTNYEKRQLIDALRPSGEPRASNLGSMSYSRSKGSLRTSQTDIAARGLANAVNDLLSPGSEGPSARLLDRRRGSNASAGSSIGPGLLPASPALSGDGFPTSTAIVSPDAESSTSAGDNNAGTSKLDPSLAMSPISFPSDPASSLAPGDRDAPISFAALAAATGLTENQVALLSKRRGSVASSSGSIVAPGDSRRPSLGGRSKTTSTAAVNEAQASGVSISQSAVNNTNPLELRSTLTRSSSSGSVSGLAEHVADRLATSEGAADLLARGRTAGRHSRESGKQHLLTDTVNNDLADSILALRVVANGSQDAGLNTSSISANSQPARAGQREPPHGLGRTVREAINLKLFPTYANPPPVNDWDVPVSLLDLGGRMGGLRSDNAHVRGETSNWDLTMATIYPFIDGINHVKRISQLADADLELTRQCMEHLLYYGCVLMSDVFQFWNIYTLRPAIARMAVDPTLQTECGPYVTRPGHTIPPWPTLLALYTALRPGVTLDQWVEDREAEDMGIDVRRFITFGIIKGFVRRLHRYPLLLGGVDGLFSEPATPADLDATMITLRDQPRQTHRAEPTEQGSAVKVSAETEQTTSESSLERPSASRQVSEVASIRTVTDHDQGSRPRPRDQSASSKAKKRSSNNSPAPSRRPTTGTARASHPTATVSDAANIYFDERMVGGIGPTAKHYQQVGPSQTGQAARDTAQLRSSTGILRSAGASSAARQEQGTASNATGLRSTFLDSGLTTTPGALVSPQSSRPSHLRGSASQYFSAHQSANGSRGITPADGVQASGSNFAFPSDLPYLLDGTHCEDELCVRFGVSWPQLRRMLIHIGELATSQQQQETQRRESMAEEGGKTARGTHGADWPVETPAFANASGFAGQSGFFGGSAFHLNPGGAAASTSAMGLRNAASGSQRPALSGNNGSRHYSSTHLGSTTNANAAGGVGASDRRGSQGRGANHRSDSSITIRRGDAAMSGPFPSGLPATPSATAATAFGRSWTQPLEALEIEGAEEEMEKRGVLGGSVLLITL